MNAYRKFSATVLVLTIILLLVADAGANGDLGRLVDERIARYSRLFPEIGFMRLHGDRNVEALGQLLTVLGRDARNIDYEHNDESRKLLVELQVNRIGFMMQSRSPSATLFRLGADSPFQRPLLCVITLDVAPYEADPVAAARFLGATGTNATAVPVYNHEFLGFTVDHEVFHCLDGYSNGKIYSMNTNEEQRLQEEQRAEARADYFAALSHVAEGGDWQLVRRMIDARRRGLEDGDVAHDTEAALVAALGVTPLQAGELSVRNRARLALAH